jgi:hypothetical protein
MILIRRKVFVAVGILFAVIVIQVKKSWYVYNIECIVLKCCKKGLILIFYLL